MKELSPRKRARLLTDIAFATTLAVAASFGIVAAQAQVIAPSQQTMPPSNQKGDKDKPKEPATTGETRAAPAPRLSGEQTRPPISGRPLDEPDKVLNSAPPEKIEGK